MPEYNPLYIIIYTAYIARLNIYIYGIYVYIYSSLDPPSPRRGTSSESEELQTTACDCSPKPKSPGQGHSAGSRITAHQKSPPKKKTWLFLVFVTVSLVEFSRMLAGKSVKNFSK